MNNREKSLVISKDEGKIFPISTDDAEVVAFVRAKGLVLRCFVGKVKKTDDFLIAYTEYFGSAEFGGSEWRFRLFYPNSSRVKQAIIQFVMSTTIPKQPIGAESRIEIRDGLFINNGEFLTISTDDIEIMASVKVRGRLVKCLIERVEKSYVNYECSYTEYFGWTEYRGEKWNFRLFYPDRFRVKQAMIQFVKLGAIKPQGVLEKGTIYDGQILEISIDDVEFTASVKMKGLLVKCFIERAERDNDTNFSYTEYFGWSEIGGEKWNFRLFKPNPGYKIKQSMIQLVRSATINPRQEIGAGAHVINDGEVITISAEDVKIAATVKAKGQMRNCNVSRIATTPGTTEYLGWTVIEGKEYNFRIVYPNSKRVKKATVQFNALS